MRSIIALAVLALALPAFEETKGNWRAQSDFAVTFLDRYGNEIGHRGIIHEDSVPIDELPDHLIKAVLATEDRRFFDHWGIDFLGLARAMTENARAGGVVQGGSTLTQQLAKNLYLGREKTLARKIQEALLTLLLEQELSKKELMELYLNVVELGPGIYGVGPAAEHYFKTPAKELTLGQSLYLASILPDPTRQHFLPTGEVTERWSEYLRKLMRIARKVERITDDELETGLAEQVGFRKGSEVSSAVQAPNGELARDEAPRDGSDLEQGDSPGGP